MNVQDKIWEEIEPKVYITREQFFNGVSVCGYETDGELTFASIRRGSHYHFMTFGKPQPISMQFIRDQLQPIIDEYGFVRTMTPREDKRQHRFNRMIGFVIESEDEFFTHFRAGKLRFHGGRQCP